MSRIIIHMKEPNAKTRQVPVEADDQMVLVAVQKFLRTDQLSMCTRIKAAVEAAIKAAPSPEPDSRELERLPCYLAWKGYTDNEGNPETCRMQHEETWRYCPVCKAQSDR